MKLGSGATATRTSTSTATATAKTYDHPFKSIYRKNLWKENLVRNVNFFFLLKKVKMLQLIEQCVIFKLNLQCYWQVLYYLMFFDTAL